ncbi:MAG: outer membrane beta-barrel protein [Alphaproteobacteria bacterium]|nr:outer membrane beta-barrel protein [Alphaproteobacteria bacterium]
MTLRTLLAGATAIATLTGLAHAGPVHGWYVALEGGANFVDDINRVEEYQPGPVFLHETLSLKSGWGVFGTIGRALDEHWRVEGEIGYRENKDDHLTGLSGEIDVHPGGINSEFTLMANVIYDIMLDERWSVSLGAGLGADRGHTSSKTYGFEDTDWSFAYQGIAGVNYAMGERSALFVNVRYLAVDGFDYHDGSSPYFGIWHDNDIRKETVTIGLRFALAPPGS